jgi:hypothetical protein
MAFSSQKSNVLRRYLNRIKIHPWVAACKPFSRPLLGLHGTGQGATFQISAEYFTRVLSLENFPEPAILKMAYSAQASGLA